MNNTEANAEEATQVSFDWFTWRFGFLDEDETHAIAKEWCRRDALIWLRFEFNLHDPNRHPDDMLDYLAISDINDGHPQYNLYVELENLINAHYDEINGEIEAGVQDDAQIDEFFDDDEEGWAGKETYLIRKTSSKLRAAYVARLSGHKNWEELLPSQAEVMLSRFVEPYGALHNTTATLGPSLGRMWMAEVSSGVSGI